LYPDNEFMGVIHKEPFPHLPGKKKTVFSKWSGEDELIQVESESEGE